MLNITISGFCGRMGERIACLACKDNYINLVGALENKSCKNVGKDIGEILGIGQKGILLTSNITDAIEKSDLMIEFTTPEATISNLKICLEKRVNLVIGTTGLSDEQMHEIKLASKDIAIVQSFNMSIGVNLLFELVEILSKKIYKDADIEIIETHHKYKKDAPSGTAVTIANIISKIKNKDLKEIAVFGRTGNVGERSKEEIGIHALRASDVTGEHTIVFGLDGERLELTHKAHNRDIFAFGALKAAKFLSDKKSGLYSMKDVLAA